MNRILFAAASVAAICAAGPASADFSSTLAGDYQWASWGHGEDVLALHGATTTPVDWNDISVQANGDYRYRFGTGANISTGDLDATIAWNGLEDWRIAATGGAKITTNETLWHIGGGAEWFILPDLSIAAKALDVIRGGFNAGDYGGQATFYVDPDLAFSASAMKDIFDDQTDYTLQAEYLFWDKVSIYAGWVYEPSPINSFFIGLKLYCDGPAPGSLVDVHRTGPLKFIPGYTNLDWDT